MKKLIILIVLALASNVFAGRGLIGASASGSGSVPDSIARYDLTRTFTGAESRMENWGGSPVITPTLTKMTTVKPDGTDEACWVYRFWTNIEGADSTIGVTPTPSMTRYRSVLETEWLLIDFLGTTPDTITRTMVEDSLGNWKSVGAILTTEHLIGMFRADPAVTTGNEYAEIEVNRRADATYTAAFATNLNCAIPVKDSLQIWRRVPNITAAGTLEDMAWYGKVWWWDLPSESQLLGTHMQIHGGDRVPFRYDLYPQVMIDRGPGWLYYRGFGISQGGYTIASNNPWSATWPYTPDWRIGGAQAGDPDTDARKLLEEDFHIYKDSWWPVRTIVAANAVIAGNGTGTSTIQLRNPGVTGITPRTGIRAAWLNDIEGVFAKRPAKDKYGLFGLTFAQRNAASPNPWLFANTDSSQLFRQYNIADRTANPWVYTITQGENGSAAADTIVEFLPAGSVAWDYTDMYDHITGVDDWSAGWYNHRVKSFAKRGQSASTYFSYDIDSTYKYYSEYDIFDPMTYRWSDRFSIWREKGRKVNSSNLRTGWEKWTYITYTFDPTPTPQYTTVVDSLPLINTKYYSTGVGNAVIPTVCWGEGGGILTEYSDSAAIADNTVTLGAFYLGYAYRQDSNNRYDFRHPSWTFSLVGLPSSTGTYYEDVIVDSANIYFAYNNVTTAKDEMTSGDSISIHGFNFGPGLYPTAQSPHDHKVLNPQPIGVRDLTDFISAPNAHVSIPLLADSIRPYMGDTLRLGSTVMKQECRCKDAQDGAGDKVTSLVVHGYGTALQPYIKIWRRLRVRT